MPLAKIKLSCRSGEWRARFGPFTAYAPFRVVRRGPIGSGVQDLGRYDALEKLFKLCPGLERQQYVLQETP